MDRNCERKIFVNYKRLKIFIKFSDKIRQLWIIFIYKFSIIPEIVFRFQIKAIKLNFNGFSVTPPYINPLLPKYGKK